MNKLAEKFGGGGHPTASGARIMGTLNEARNKVLDGITNQFYQNNNDSEKSYKQSEKPQKKQHPTNSRNSEIYS